MTAQYDLGRFMEQQWHQWTSEYETDGQALIDGPLSDLSVLIQIPKVRELAAHIVASTEIGWSSTTGNDWDDEEMQRMYVVLRDALEATS